MGESALQSHMKGIFISLFLPCVKGSERELKQFWALRKKEAKCVGTGYTLEER